MTIKTKAPKLGKQGLWNKIVIPMLDGTEVTPDELKEFFKNDAKVSYFIPSRLSTVMWQIKTFEGGIVKVTKDGKKVVAYKLVNASEFDSNGFGPLRQPKKSGPVAQETTVETIVETTTENTEEVV
jgi:hypothetical protein